MTDLGNRNPHNAGAAERFCWCGGALENIAHPLYGKCRDCGTLVLRRSFTENELKSFYGYQQYWHDHQANVSGYPTIKQRAENDFHDRIPVWHRVLAANHSSPRRVLEIGCAHGGFLHYCRQQGSDVVVGVEVDEATCKFARDHFGLPHVVSGLFPAVKLPLDQFDVICGFDVVEHFLDPVEGLRAVAKILAPDGICFFQTPCHRGEGSDWKQFRPQEHIFLYTEASIRRLFETCGLEVMEIVPGYFPDDMFIVGRLKTEVTKSLGVPGRCWCGGSLVPSVHELYGCCEKCGTQVLRQHITPSELKAFYTFNHYWHEHQTKDLSCPPIEQRASDDLKDRVPVWHKLLSQLKPGVQTLLEIGCAHGGFLHYCRERGIPNVVGVEVDESTCEFARTRFDLPHIYSGLFPEVKLPLENFDAITGFDVLEHLADPVAALKEVGRLLADDGVFLFQLPCYRGEGREWRMFCPMNHLFLYNEQSLRQLFALSGLEVDQILPGHFPEDVFVLGRKRSDVRRVLWVRLDSIGDAVIASSMLPWIQKKYPKASISVLCQQHVADVYLAAPMIDSVICLERKHCEDEAYLKEIISEIAAFNPQLILNSTRSRDFLSELLTLAFQDARHIGIESDAVNLPEAERAEAASRYFKIIPSPGQWKPELERHHDFLKGLGIESPSLQPLVWTSAEDEAVAEAFFKQHGLDPIRTIALFPGAKDEYRIYPHFAAALHQLEGYSFLIFGGSEVEALGSKLAAELPGTSINLAGKSSLREMAALFRRCRLYVGAESAGAHVACAVNLPNVVVLGGGHCGRFMPYSPLTSAVCLPLDCFGCNWTCQFSKAHCVMDIDPAIVAEAIRQTLAGSASVPRVFYKDESRSQPSTNAPRWRKEQPLMAASGAEFLAVCTSKSSGPAIIVSRPQPKISIITPSFNQGEYLEECIDSILSQNYPNLEYILMDGGSRDSSVQIIQKYAKHFAHWQSQPDAGQYDAIQKGFERSSGEIMFWLNSSDKLHPGSLEIVAEVFSQRPDVDWIMGRPTGWNESGLLTDAPPDIPLWSQKTYLTIEPRDKFIQQESTFWRHPLWDKAGGRLDLTLKHAADFELWARFFNFAQLHSVDAMLGGFRSHTGQKTAVIMREYLAEVNQVVEREARLFKRKKISLPAPPLLDPATFNVTPRQITPANFSYFTYSKQPHFGFFRDHAMTLYGHAVDPADCDLKFYQDLLVYAFIKDNVPKGSRILDIGGGDSRVLRALKTDYECWNLDKLEGLGNGLTEVNPTGYRLVKDYLGNFNPELPDNYFDFVFSISVLEHLKETQENFCDVCLDLDRIMKPGAFSLHCLDVIQGQEVWTNKFLPFVFDNIQTVNKFIPLGQLQIDPHTFYMSETAYDRLWKHVTKKSYQEFGGPLTYNVLWQKTDNTFKRKLTRSGSPIATPAATRPDKTKDGTTVKLTPSAMKSQSLVLAAQADFDRGDSREAINALQTACGVSPGNVDLLIALGNLHFQTGDFASCHEALKVAAALRSNDPLLQVLLAQAATRIGLIEEFESALARAFELDPNFIPAHRLLADLNLEAGRYADAALQYARLAGEASSDVSILMALGKCFAELKENDGAQASFERVLEIEPENDLARNNLAVIKARRISPANQLRVADDSFVETIGCPFCDSADAIRVRQSADIVRCGNCSTIYLRTRPKKEVMEKTYQTYADDGSHMALPKSFEEADRSGLKRDYFLKEILQFTKPDGFLLDVGCGWGAFLLNARQHGFQVAGHEITRKAAGYANESLQIPVKTSQFLETDYAPGTQNVVTMLHVFEHLPYPKEALDKVFQVLKPGGIFCGIVPNFDSFCSQTLGEQWFWLDPNYHYVHYTPATMRKHLEAAGFIVERIYTNTGDYGSEPIKQLLVRQDQTVSAPSIFGERLKQIEKEGRGEEIRFFARKPVKPRLVEPAEIIHEKNLGTPFVSVVVSTFNAERFLRPCLENLTRQTIFSQIEVIVVDSGSEQNERAIALEFTKKYSNIHYVRSERETIYGAWNRGLSLARGRYWANHNTDDSLRDDALAILVAALEANPECALAYGDTAWTTKPNDKLPSSNIVKTVKYPDYAPVETLFYCITGCLQFWRTDSIRKLGGFDASLSCAGDYEATLKMMVARMNAVHVPEVLSLFFQNTAGLSQATNRGDQEHLQVMNRYRANLDVTNVFQAKPGQPSTVADALAMLGAHSTHCFVPWEKMPIEHFDFAFACFHKALEIDPENITAGMNLIVANQKLDRLDSEKTELIRRWPKMREWIAAFLKGVQVKSPFVAHAVQGPVYRPSEWSDRPNAEQLDGEPKALRPWICRINGRHVYLSEELFSRPAGLRYSPGELETAARRLASLLMDIPPFYAHFGGAGDALLLLASFYDQHPDGVVFSHPNNVGATKALFDAFPKISKIYFLPQHTEPFFHIVLRYTVRELRNCRGAGATPRESYDAEWKAGLDLEKKYGIKKAPRWAADMKPNANSRRIAVAPKGSMAGMVGSKRNIILPELWTQIIDHILQQGFEPVILGLPSEANEYPALPGCIDARNESFSGQIQRIAESIGVVGADSWAKTFSALAEIPTLVFEPLKGADLAGWKDPSDCIFIEPWPAIKMVSSLDEFRQAFDTRIAGSSNISLPCGLKTVVAWEGSFLDFGSLSHVNRELSRALADTDSVRLQSINSPSQPKNVATPKTLKKIAATLSKKSSSDTQVTIRHAWPPDWLRPVIGKLVVIQPWEFGSLPETWVEAAKSVDEFWVPSNYVRNVYIESGIGANKVVVVPNGIDPEKFHAKAQPLTLATEKKFKFLFVGGTIFRKGPDVLLKAYLENFTAADDVCLVIKDFGGQSVYAGQTIEAQIRAAQTRPDSPEILYLNDELPPESLPGLYTACDCFVLPYRGEGFGLPVLEAMACGLPVVVTAGGSTDDFVRDEFAFRISATQTIFGDEISGMKLVNPGWLLEPNVAELGEKMRWIFCHPSDVSERGRRASDFAHQNFTWKNSAEIAAKRIRELATRPISSPVATPGSKPSKAASIVLPACAKVGQLSEAHELLKKKQHRAAWEMTLAAIQSRPFHPEAFLLLAEIALAAGDSVSARRCAQHARDLAPEWKPAKQFLKGNLRGNAKHDWICLPEGRARHSVRAALEPTENGAHGVTLPTTTTDAPRLSVCLIAKNEEQFIGQCLASVRGLAHQIVVVDTGSTDRTVEIAKENGAEIYKHEWNDDFSAARNGALEHVTGDWVLVLDADEELLPEHRETILKEMQADAIMAYRLPIIDKEKEQDGCSYVPRLFRNAPGLFFVGRVHEQIFSSIEVRCQEWGLKNQLGKTALLHHGYTQEMVVSRDKVSRNLKLLQQAIVELPGEPNLLMSLGLELVRSKQLAAGLEKYREALRIMGKMPPKQIVPELRETLLTQLSTHLMAAKRFAEIEQLWETPFAKSASMTASQHFLLGLAHIESKRAAEAAEQMRLCLGKRHLPTLSPIHSEILKAGPNHCLALALAVLNQNVEAGKAFRAALVDDPQSRSAKFDFARFQVERGDSLDAFKLLHELISENPDEIMVWEFGGRIALGQPEFLEFACDWTGEAIKHFPEHSRIIEQRAEALLLSGDVEAALPLWQKVQSPRSDRHVAALLLCQCVSGETLERFPSREEEFASREFLNWYRQLIRVNAVAVVCALNDRIDQLRTLLPTFVDIWTKAATQAEQVVD